MNGLSPIAISPGNAMPPTGIQPVARGAEPALARQAAQPRRVLVITYHFPPSNEIGAHACAQITRYLPLYGWQPVVLTAHQRQVAEADSRFNYAFPGPVLRTPVIPHPLTIYRRAKSILYPNVLGVRGGKAPSDVTRGLRRRLLSLLAVPDVYTGWIVPAILGGLAAIHRHRVEHLFSSGPYWTNHLVGFMLARLTRLPWTAHFRDPWAHAPHAGPASTLSRHINIALEHAVVRSATFVVCVTDSHTNLLREAHPALATEKFATIPNGFDPAEWEGLPAGNGQNASSPQRTFVITYAGSLYERRSPVPLFRAVQRLAQDREIDLDRIRIDLCGDCDRGEGHSVEELAAAFGLAHCVNITGPLSRADTLRRVSQSDLLLLLAEGLNLQIPGKTYEYLTAARPILALTSEGALADLLRRTGGAWVVDPSDQIGVAAAVREVYQAWTDGRVLPMADPGLVSGFDRRVLAGGFAELFDRGITRVYA